MDAVVPEGSEAEKSGSPWPNHVDVSSTRYTSGEVEALLQEMEKNLQLSPRKSEEPTEKLPDLSQPPPQLPMLKRRNAPPPLALTDLTWSADLVTDPNYIGFCTKVLAGSGHGSPGFSDSSARSMPSPFSPPSRYPAVCLYPPPIQYPPPNRYPSSSLYPPDPFIRGEGPLEVGSFDLRRGSVSFKFGSAARPRSMSSSEARPYHPPGIRNKVRFDYCVFCKNNGEEEKFTQSHTLKDDGGNVTCPILYKFKCPFCQATGRVAHTARYCPKMKYQQSQDMLPITTLKSMRPAAGSYSYSYRYRARFEANRFREPHRPEPNAAWSGVGSPPSITPMFGEFVNRERREARQAKEEPFFKKDRY